MHPKQFYIGHLKWLYVGCCHVKNIDKINSSVMAIKVKGHTLRCLEVSSLTDFS